MTSEKFEITTDYQNFYMEILLPVIRLLIYIVYNIWSITQSNCTYPHIRTDQKNININITYHYGG